MEKLPSNPTDPKVVPKQSEDERDLSDYNNAMEEYRKNPISFSHAEVVRMLNACEVNKSAPALLFTSHNFQPCTAPLRRIRRSPRLLHRSQRSAAEE